jgi:hypothetical protein
MKHMTRVVTGLTMAIIMATAGTLLAAQAHTPHSLTGKWVIKMADGPHGPIEMPIALTQDGTKVTAVLTPPGHDGEFKLAGEFVKGQLTLSAAASDTTMAVTMKATLKDDGTLVGYTSSDMGDSKWVGTRVKP